MVSNTKTPKVMMSCALEAGMSEATANDWDPGLWMYPLMGVHEETEGGIDQEDMLADDDGTYYFAKFDCGCEFYVPSTMLRGTYSNDTLHGDVELDEPEFSLN